MLGQKVGFRFILQILFRERGASLESIKLTIEFVELLTVD